MTMLRTLALAVLLTIALAGSALAAAKPGKPSAGKPHADDLPGRVIVTLRDGENATLAAAEYRRLGATVTAVYRTAMTGFAAQLSDTLRAALEADPRVSGVHQDRRVRSASTQSNPPWGLDRVDQRQLPLSGTYTSTDDGAGVTVYVLDTGVRATHNEFTGRVAAGFDAYGQGTTADCHGHGTHVAATAAGATMGVARAATVVPVRVMQCDGTGTWSAVIAGVDWVTAHHTQGTPAVANMSLSGDVYTPVETAIRNSVADGVTYVVAAGNQGVNTCSRTPGRMSEVLTVAATANDDSRPSWSNAGSCVDLFAPGNKIPSAGWSSDTGTATRTGTSSAAPHVAGVAALHLAHTPNALPSAVATAVLADTTTGVVTNRDGAPDRLLHSPDEHTVWPTAPEPRPSPSPLLPVPLPTPTLLP